MKAQEIIQASDLLKTVDKLIKNGELGLAAETIDKALELEPRNIYARAYKERVEELQSENKKQSPAQPFDIQPINQQSDGTPKISVTKKLKSQKIFNAIIEAYETLLNEIWKDGNVTEEEMDRVEAMRNSLGISIEEHALLEIDARITSFLLAVKEQWKKGNHDLDPLKRTFMITDEEDFIIQSKVEQVIQSLGAETTIMIMDDDEDLLFVLTKQLQRFGYFCVTARTGEDAFMVLETITPDLVICDLSFGQQYMNGFAVYEKFRSIEKFHHIPFVFLTGLNQEQLVKTGKMLGADDYLLKPVDNNLLIATIQGKLRRSQANKK